MKNSITRNGKEEKQKEENQDRKFLNMVIDGKLKDPSPFVIKKISDELGMDITASDDH